MLVSIISCSHFLTLFSEIIICALIVSPDFVLVKEK